MASGRLRQHGYDHVDVFWGPTLRLNQQVGVFILAASLATLVVATQLASRRFLQLIATERVDLAGGSPA